MNHSKLFFPFFILLLASTTFAQTSVGLSSPTNNTLDVVVLDNNGNLSYIAWTGKSWSKWKKLEGEMNPNHPIQTISVENGRTEIVAVTKTNALVHAFLKNKKLSEWKPLVIFPGSTPKLVSWGPGRLDILTTNKKGEIIQTYFTRGKWSKRWKNIGGNVRENQSPSVVAQAKGKLDIFYRSKEGLIKHKSWNKNAWSGWETVPGMRLSSPVVASSMANGRLDLFTRGSKGEVMNSSKIFGRWSKWVNIGKDISGQKGIRVHKRGENLDIFYINRPGQLLHQTANSKGRSKWSVITNKAIQLPSTTSWSSNRTDISFLNDKGELQQAYFNGKKWSSLRNKGKRFFINIPNVNPSMVNVPSLSALDYFSNRPEYFENEYSTQLIDQQNVNNSNKNNTEDDPIDLGWVEQSDGFICKTFELQNEENDPKDELKVVGDMPAGIVAGAIIQRDIFEDTNFNLVWNAPVKRNTFNLNFDDDNLDPFTVNDLNGDALIRFSEINTQLDSHLRKINDLTDRTYGIEAGVYEYFHGNNIKRTLFKLGISAKYLSAKAKFNLEKKKYRYSESYLVYDRVEYFNITASKNTEVDWIKENQNKDNLLLVDEVTYGKNLLIKIEKKIEKESISWSLKAEAKFGAEVDAETKNEIKEEKSEYTISVFSIGGNELEGFKPLGIITGKYASVEDALKAIDDAEDYSHVNRGYPIAYKLLNLKTGGRLYFENSAPKITEKTLCIPRETEYLIRLKKLRVKPGSDFGDSDDLKYLIFEGEMNVKLNRDKIGNLLSGTDRNGANPYRSNERPILDKYSTGLLRPLKKDQDSIWIWTHTPGFIAEGNRKRALPRFNLTKNLLDRNAILKINTDLTEVDFFNPDDNFSPVPNEINLRELIAKNPEMHNFGADHKIEVELRPGKILDVVLEFIPVNSSVDRLPLVTISEDNDAHEIKFNRKKATKTATNMKSSLKYTNNGSEGICLSQIESSELKQNQFAIDGKFANLTPGILFKYRDLLQDNVFNENLPDTLVRRTPIELTIENLTSVGSNYSNIISTTVNNNIQRSTIRNEIRNMLINNRINLRATSNSDISVTITKSAKQAMFSAGLSVGSPFIDVDLEFFKQSNKEKETIFVILEREFFKVSARPLPYNKFVYSPYSQIDQSWTIEHQPFGNQSNAGNNSSYDNEVSYSNTTNNSTINDRYNLDIDKFNFNLNQTITPLSEMWSDDILERLNKWYSAVKINSDSILESQGYAYIGEVTYGERIVIKFETGNSENITDLKAKIKAKFMGFQGSVSTEYNSFESDEYTNVKAIYWGSTTEIPRRLTSKDDIMELFNDFSRNTNRFNTRRSSLNLGNPLRFKAFRVGSNEVLGTQDVNDAISSNFFCTRKHMRIDIRVEGIQAIGPWRDRGRGNSLKIYGTVKPFFIFDEGRARKRERDILFNRSSSNYVEVAIRGTQPNDVTEEDNDPKAVLEFDTSRTSFLTYKDILNGKMYLQFDIGEYDGNDRNDRMHSISKGIPIYNLIPDNNLEPKKVDVIMQRIDRPNRKLLFRLSIERGDTRG